MSSILKYHPQIRTIINMSMNVKIVFDTANTGCLDHGANDKVFEILSKYKVKDLDTAYIYVNLALRLSTIAIGSVANASQEGSEKALGARGAPADYAVHIKAPGFTPGALTEGSISKTAKKSFEWLGTDHIGFPFSNSCVYPIAFWLGLTLAEHPILRVFTLLNRSANAGFQVEAYFLHSPDRETPKKETMEAIQRLFEASRFKRVSLMSQRSTFVH